MRTESEELTLSTALAEAWSLAGRVIRAGPPSLAAGRAGRECPQRVDALEQIAKALDINAVGTIFKLGDHRVLCHRKYASNDGVAAERAGLSARYVGAIERGDVSASVTVLGQIAEALGVEPGDLLLRRSSRKG